MGDIVLLVPGLTPAAYWELSHEETIALIEANNRNVKAANKAAKRKR